MVQVPTHVGDPKTWASKVLILGYAFLVLIIVSLLLPSNMQILRRIMSTCKSRWLEGQLSLLQCAYSYQGTAWPASVYACKSILHSTHAWLSVRVRKSVCGGFAAHNRPWLLQQHLYL
jgi:hypothetical protein